MSIGTPPEQVPHITSGWYPSPDGSCERYWDGTQWTDYVRRFGQPVQPAYAQPAKNDGLAVASMVLGICSVVLFFVPFLLSILGFVFGVIALRRCQPQGPNQGRGMAIAGIACSSVMFALWVVIIAAAAAGA